MAHHIPVGQHVCAVLIIGRVAAIIHQHHQRPHEEGLCVCCMLLLLDDRRKSSHFRPFAQDDNSWGHNIPTSFCLVGSAFMPATTIFSQPEYRSWSIDDSLAVSATLLTSPIVYSKKNDWLRSGQEVFQFDHSYCLPSIS